MGRKNAGPEIDGPSTAGAGILTELINEADNDGPKSKV